MMLDHDLEKEAIELGPLCRGQARHLLGREHPRHQRGVVAMVRVRVGSVLAAGLQPVLHHVDLVDLRSVDAPASIRMSSRAVRDVEQADHVDRLRVVADHPLHEAHVRWRIRHVRQVGSRRRGNHTTRLARSAGLHDRHSRLRGGALARGGDTARQQDDGEACRPGHVTSL